MSRRVHKVPVTRRVVLGGGTAVAGLAAFSTRVLSAAPPPVVVDDALVAAARKEGKVVWYSAMDLIVAQKLAKAFEARHPGIPVRVERSGSERLFQRIALEHASRIYAVDIVNSADAAHAVAWKRDGLLAPFLSDEMAHHLPPAMRDVDGHYATVRVYLCVIGYNSSLVKAEEAPKGYLDLLDPKWVGRIVKGHPGYSGTIMTATFQIARALGWEYFERLAQQKVMQVQSSVDPPKKIALGERAVMADGGDYNVLIHRNEGAPVEVVYPVEGCPVITSPNAVFKNAPNPNAARLLQAWMFSADGQQALVDISGQYPVHALVKARTDRKPLAAIKLLKDDPEAVEREAEEIKARYLRYFKV